MGFSWAELSKTIMFATLKNGVAKILAKNFPNVPIAKDVKELANDPERFVPDHDILSCGYPANRSQLQDLEKEKKMTVTSGRASLELLQKKTLLGRLRKRLWSRCLGSRQSVA